jgi:membrane protein DedA with SNARE-associated domain
VEELIRKLSALDPTWVYLSVAGIAFIENIIPPIPSDVIVVFAGSLVGIGAIDFWWALVLTTIGSTIGFMVMYKIGDWFGLKILEKGKLKFIPKDSVHKVEGWFRKYGYLIIVVNRFLAGTRAVVSFIAGMSELKLPSTTLLCFLSALVWNFLLLVIGQKLGQNWKVIFFYMETYSKTVTGIVIIVILLIVARFVYRRLSHQNNSQNSRLPGS